MKSIDGGAAWYTVTTEMSSKERIVAPLFRQYASATTKGDFKAPLPYECYTIWKVPGSFYSRDVRSWIKEFVRMEPYYADSFGILSDFKRFNNNLTGSLPASCINYNVDMQGRLATRCYARVSAATYALGSELVELDETASYIASRLETVSQGLLAVVSLNYRGVKRLFGPRKKRFKQKLSARAARKVIGAAQYATLSALHGKEHAQRVASLWLEYRYAFSPLLHSVEDAIKVYNEGLGLSPNPIFDVWDKIEESISFKKVYKDDPVWGNDSKHFVGKEIWRMKLTVKLKNVNLHIKEGHSINQASMIWERIPFSWVIDWSWNIAETLEAIAARNNTEYRYGYQSVRGDVKVTQTLVNVRGGSSLTTSTAHARISYYRRWVLSSSPIPIPEFSNPFRDGPWGYLHTNRIFDALSLATLWLTGKPSAKWLT